MARKSPNLQLEEKAGNQYNDLNAAQRDALLLMSSHLADVIRDLLNTGVLVQVNGKIIPRNKVC
jgi:hypothetical protein